MVDIHPEGEQLVLRPTFEAQCLQLADRIGKSNHVLCGHRLRDELQSRLKQLLGKIRGWLQGRLYDEQAVVKDQAPRAPTPRPRRVHEHERHLRVARLAQGERRAKGRGEHLQLHLQRVVHRLGHVLHRCEPLRDQRSSGLRAESWDVGGLSCFLLRLRHRRLGVASVGRVALQRRVLPHGRALAHALVGGGERGRQRRGGHRLRGLHGPLHVLHPSVALQRVVAAEHEHPEDGVHLPKVEAAQEQAVDRLHVQDVDRLHPYSRLLAIVRREATDRAVGRQAHQLLTDPALKMDGADDVLPGDRCAALAGVREGQGARAARPHEEARGDHRRAPPPPCGLSHLPREACGRQARRRLPVFLGPRRLLLVDVFLGGVPHHGSAELRVGGELLPHDVAELFQRLHRVGTALPCAGAPPEEAEAALGSAEGRELAGVLGHPELIVRVMQSDNVPCP
mmetsp:Transcript_14356/g.41236  ORF Transcript_14356/g.41236 Transcript_14356/m.41236 type:complete len:452 (+) Transcript_14356:1193-2548(+)